MLDVVAGTHPYAGHTASHDRNLNVPDIDSVALAVHVGKLGAELGRPRLAVREIARFEQANESPDFSLAFLVIQPRILTRLGEHCVLHPKPRAAHRSLDIIQPMAWTHTLRQPCHHARNLLPWVVHGTSARWRPTVMSLAGLGQGCSIRPNGTPRPSASGSERATPRGRRQTASVTRGGSHPSERPGARAIEPGRCGGGRGEAGAVVPQWSRNCGTLVEKAQAPVTTAMNTLFDRLGAAGLDAAYVRRTVLPSWWCDEVAETPAGLAQTRLILSRRLGIALSEFGSDAPPSPTPRTARFKLTSATAPGEVAWAKLVALQAADIVARCVDAPVAPLPTCAVECRRAILESGAPWIGFDQLLGYCWSVGVPVLHISKLPRPKMVALVARVEGRPVIVLCQERQEPSWLLFHLAHEFGHLVCGHLAADEVLTDDVAMGGDHPSSDEESANRFACTLLGGEPPARIPAALFQNARAVADRALKLGTAASVDPGHLSLVYAHAVNRPGLGSAALKYLPESGDALELIRAHMNAASDWSRVSEDELEFASRVMDVDLEL